MKDFIKNNYIYIIVIMIILGVMTFFMTKKEGFHEDELFSYGSSNYYYDNVFRRYGRSDATNIFMKEKIFKGNILKNVKTELIDNNANFQKYLDDFDLEKHPVWRTKDEAKDYLVLTKHDKANLLLVYYNQSRDVHPPLFYFAVHIICRIFSDSFSKYLAYIVNAIFMVCSLWMIKKIFEIIDKKNLIVPGLLLYGLSIGAVTTAIFLRMYAMLTFFGLLFLYENIKILKNDYEIDKKEWIKLGFITILGFLTQYYFCILAFVIAVVIFIKICKKKDKKKIIKYILNYLKIALIGVLVFPASIYHIFFSYRGVNDAIMEKSYISKLGDYFKLLDFAYSIPVIIIILITLIALGFIIFKNIKREKQSDNTLLAMLTLLIITYFLVIVKVSPELEIIHTLRYLMPIFPIIMILLLLSVDGCFENNKKVMNVVLIVVSILVSVYGLITSKPAFLYEGYNKYLKIAEENKELKFVYVGDSGFCHMQSMQEFALYDESLIVYENELEYVINDEKLKNENEFIISIKKYENDEEILNKIIGETEFKNYELLLDDNGEVNCKIYKVKR